MLKSIERAGRTCYKSEDQITDESSEKFIKMLVERGHESVLEHEKISILFVCDRGVSHEIVRHRLANYSQESTRYVNYTKDKFGGEIKFIDIKEGFPEITDDLYKEWKYGCESSEATYQAIIENGGKTDFARSVLNNSIATEIVMTADLREWLHFIKLRIAQDAHPEIRVIARKLLQEFKPQLPEIFGGIDD